LFQTLLVAIPFFKTEYLNIYRLASSSQVPHCNLDLFLLKEREGQVYGNQHYTTNAVN